MYTINKQPFNTLDFLEDKDQISIVEQYCNIKINLKSNIRSFFRTDNTPSCKFIVKNDNLYFKDFTTGDRWSYIDFIIKFNNIDFQTFCSWIEKSNTSEIIQYKSKQNISQSNFEIFISKRDYTLEDLKFWAISDLHITETILKKYKIYPLKGYVLYGNSVLADNHTYFFEHNFQQVYTPAKSKPDGRYKGKTSSGIHGWNYLKNYDKVIITKSFIDWFYLNLLGFNCLHVISEGYKYTEKDVKNLSKFKSVYILYDLDEAGTNNANRLKVYGYKPIFYKHEKDTKDMLKKYKSIDIIRIVNQLMLC